MRHNTLYIFVFAAIICIVCGVFVSYAAVALKDRQVVNEELDKKKNILQAAGFIEPGEAVDADRVAQLFENIETIAVDLKTGAEDPSIDAESYDQLKAANDPATSFAADPNPAAVQRIPNHAQVFKVKKDDGSLDMLVMPIEGLGLWGTLYGFLALDADLETVRGITYYRHKETPGLGGEVDNPRWKALWPGRKLFDDSGNTALAVIKGVAGSPADAPYAVDGLSGATLTSRGVTNMLDFWFAEDLFGRYLDQLAPAAASAAPGL